MHTGHKSSRWVLLFYSLPFAVPTYSCITKSKQICFSWCFLLFFFLSVSGRARNSRSLGTTICQCKRVRACTLAGTLCNPGLCENVITCMSKRALVYVSEMAPVKSESGLPAHAQLQMSRSQGWGLFGGGGMGGGLSPPGYCMKSPANHQQCR